MTKYNYPFFIIVISYERLIVSIWKNRWIYANSDSNKIYGLYVLSLSVNKYLALSLWFKKQVLRILKELIAYAHSYFCSAINI